MLDDEFLCRVKKFTALENQVIEDSTWFLLAKFSEFEEAVELLTKEHKDYVFESIQSFF